MKKHHYRDVSTTRDGFNPCFHIFVKLDHETGNLRGTNNLKKGIVSKKHHLDHLAAFIAFNVPLLFTNKSLPEIARTPKLLAMKLVVNGVKKNL